MSREKRLVNKFWNIFWGGFLLGSLGPFFHSFIKILEGDGYRVTECNNSFNPDPYSLFILIPFIVWLSLFFSIYKFKIYNAVYIMFSLAAGRIIVFMVFNVLAVFILDCKGLDKDVSELYLFIVWFSVFFVFLVFFFMRSRWIRLVKVNESNFDFNKGLCEVSAPMIPINKKINTHYLSKIIVISSFIGMFLANIPWGRFIELHTDSEIIISVSVMWITGCSCVAFLGVGDLYITWLVWSESRRKRVVMMCSELIRR